MPYKCSVAGCISISSTANCNVQVSLHSFPLNDPNTLQHWIRFVNKDNFTPTKYSKICSLHFLDADFVNISEDSNKRRSKEERCLTKRYMRPGAVPTLTKIKTERSVSTSTGRYLRELEHIKQIEMEFEQKEELEGKSLIDIYNDLMIAEKPSGFRLEINGDVLYIYNLALDSSSPKIMSSLTISADLSFNVAYNGNTVSRSAYSNIISGNRLSTFSQILNIMAILKSLNETNDHNLPHSDILSAIVCIDKAKSAYEKNSVEYIKCTFLIEQLELLIQNKHHRAYSPDLTIFAYLIHAESHAAYMSLLNQNVLSLPSITTLKKITRKVNTERGLSNISYLRLRQSKLEEMQRHCLLMIDEIYIRKQPEYSGGRIYGLTDDSKVANTLLCFMIKSIAGKYKDIVAIYPISGLTALKLSECYEEVMKLINLIPFNVVAISVDNAAVNRRFYMDLCNNNLQVSVQNPFTHQPLFLLIDPVHNIKNIYNNFQTRKILKCPPNPPLAPNGFNANFHHIKELYELESSSSLRKAHRLTSTVIHPQSIERTSVKLACAVFSESTRDALQFYTNNENRQWTGTLIFIDLILKIWKVLNVKSSTKGYHKRDISQDPVKSSSDWKLECLREFSQLLKFWQSNSDYGLSKETFLALSQSCIAIADCAAYLLDMLGFSFVLLGKLQSDNIESRFGWFRQLSGSNYFISMRQVIESDIKIRAISLLKFSKFVLSDIDEALLSDEREEEDFPDDIVDQIDLDFEPSASDANIIFYVAGAVSRSCVRTSKCSSCEETLLTSEISEPLDIDEEIDYPSSTFLDEINRGGLRKCTNNAFNIVLLAWKTFESIRRIDSLRNIFLHRKNQRSFFCNLVERFSLNSEMHLFCTKGHNVKQVIVFRFFNCLSKNFVQNLSERAPQSKKRKIQKLTGK